MYANAGLDDPLESESGSAPGSQPSDDMNIQSDKLLNFQDYTEQSNKETEKSGKKGRETTEYLESVAQSAEQTQSDAEANFEA